MNNGLPLTPTEQRFDIGLFQNSKDNVPMPRTWDWGQVTGLLNRHRVRAGKDGPCWSPTEYAPDATRGNKGVVALSMAVLDMGDGTPYETIRDLFPGIAHIAYSTFSHESNHPKYRVVIPLATPVPVADWPAFWARLNEKADGHVDRATKDAARIYYLPSHPPGGEASCFVHVITGRFLELADLPPAVTPVTGVLMPVSAGTLSASGQALYVAPGSTPLGTKEELAEVVKRCVFMQKVSDPQNQPTVPEPLWMAMISNACRFDDPDWIHQASNAYPGYDPIEVDKRIDRHRNASGPVTCKAIQELGFAECPKGGCLLPRREATKAPAGLACWWQKPAIMSLKKAPPMSIATAFASSSFGDLIHHAHDSFYTYQDGYWKRMANERLMQQALMRFLELREVVCTTRLLTEVLELLAIDRHGVWETQTRHLICLENGTLDPESGSLLPHDPKHDLRFQLPITWDANSVCPRWEQTLNEIFAPDADKADKIALLQEWFGYCLVPDTRQHKFLWLVGGGGNGKSLVLDVLEAIVGRDNINHAQLERLDKGAVRAELEGKLVNISSEMSPDATVGDGYLKQIVAGDPIEAERKYERPFSFVPFCRLVGATNELPRLLDQSHGFARRALFLTFNRRFTEAEQNRELLSELRSELPGILAWSVRGLQRLRVQGKFTEPPSATAALAEYRKESDPAQMYVEENTTPDPNGVGESTSDLYTSYKEWCLAHGFKQSTSITFGKRLKALGIHQVRTSTQRRWPLKIAGVGWGVLSQNDAPTPPVGIFTPSTRGVPFVPPAHKPPYFN